MLGETGKVPSTYVFCFVSDVEEAFSASNSAAVMYFGVLHTPTWSVALWSVAYLLGLLNSILVKKREQIKMHRDV